MHSETSAMEPQDRSSHVPRTVWLLWLQGWDNAPGTVGRCASLWRWHNPDWRVIELSLANLRDYVDPTDLPALMTCSPNHQSDLIRAAILRRHGGVWADATLLCRRPLRDWVDPYLESGFFAFSDPGPGRLCASWFMCSEDEGPIVSRLHDSLTDFFSATPSRPSHGRLRRMVIARLAPLVNARVSWTAIWFSNLSLRHVRIRPYYSLHYAFNRLVRTDPACRAQWSRTPKYPADGPHLVARLGMSASVTPDIRRQIDECSEPVLKLSWKHDALNEERGTAVGYALSSAEDSR